MDDRYRDPDTVEDTYEEDAPRRSRWPTCLFVGLSLVVIASLLASSLAGWFYLRRYREVQTQPPTMADVAPLVPEVVSSPEATVAIRAPEATAAATAAPATVIAAQPTAAPTRVPDGQAINRIVIINGDGQVETLAPTGQDRRVLTGEGNNVFFQFPTWAPDGRQVAVIGSGFSGGGIYVLPDAPTSGSLAEQEIFFSADEMPFYLYWSPDSQNLAFLANHSQETMGLNVVAGDGTGDRRLLATGSPFYWEWTEDGRQLLIHSGRGRREHDLTLIDLQGQTQAENLATPGDFQAPGIAAGGRYWAFAEQDGSGSSLVVVDTQTGERQRYEQGGPLALSWSPTRDQIAYTSSGIDGHPFWGPLRVLDIPGGETRLLSRQMVLAFFWSPDGRSIAYITAGQGEEDGGINALAKTRPVARRAAQQGQALLTLSVVDVDSGRGLRLLDFEPTLVYLSQYLPFFDQYALSHQVWSPDGSALVLPVRQEDENVVLIVPTRGGQAYRLAEGDIAFWSQR